MLGLHREIACSASCTPSHEAAQELARAPTPRQAPQGQGQAEATALLARGFGGFEDEDIFSGYHAAYGRRRW